MYLDYYHFIVTCLTTYGSFFSWVIKEISNFFNYLHVYLDYYHFIVTCLTTNGSLVPWVIKEISNFCNYLHVYLDYYHFMSYFQWIICLTDKVLVFWVINYTRTIMNWQLVTLANCRLLDALENCRWWTLSWPYDIGPNGYLP